MRFRSLARGVLAVVIGTVATSALVASAQEPTSITLAPEPAKTIALHRCGSAALSSSDGNCHGFSAADILSDPSIFVVGFESNNDLNEKHVMQLILQFDLTKIAVGPNQEIDYAELRYSEVSTTRRSAAGDSEYGILQSCNTRLGVPTTDWDGRVDRLVDTRPALSAGVTPATTAESGTWDVLPQIQAWKAAGQQKVALVMGADDQSADVHEMSMCLSYMTDISLTVQVSPKPE